MTIAMRSLLLNDIVRDGENVQLPSVNLSAGFILTRDATSAVNDALITVKKALSRITQIVLHCPYLESSSLIFH